MPWTPDSLNGWCRIALVGRPGWPRCARTPSCLLVFVLIQSGAGPRSGPAVPRLDANSHQVISIDTSALCDPTMPDWKNFGGDIEVGVIVDEREVVLGR